ncbi:MAG TPA: signal peptide peptidase SppA [Kofleriaceae bacterium]|nr:signal peptide peptidase SppA [Kofleriaceae bacterium]
MRTLVVLVVAFGGSSIAHAQGVDRRYAEEPTGGVAMPATPLAGEQDARAVSMNPGGLSFLRGPEVSAVLDLQDPDVATSSGAGFGLFAGGAFSGKYGYGIGLEWLRPARSQLEPDPGQPVRLTWASSYRGLGVSWHHYFDDGPLGGKDTFDAGLSTRWGNYLAIGAAVRDINAPTIGGVPVQRRYELEVSARPFATDRLELAAGGRIGETRGDLDGWGRVSVRAARGVYVHAQLESNALHVLEDTTTSVADVDGREIRATVGVELSLGTFGASVFGSGLRNERGERHALGSTIVLRASAVGEPSMLGHSDHIERVELTGDIGVRELTALVMRLRAIARDASAKALVVTFDGVSSGWAGLQELRDEIIAVKHAGKKVFAYMVSGTGRDYFVATAADKIYIDPAGSVGLVGIAGTTVYLKGAFDLVGVLPQFEKIAEYKSAPEQFTETHPSTTAAQMHNDMFDSLWEQWIAAVAAGRHLSHDEVKAIVDAGPYTAGDLAKDQKLVDAVATPEKIAELVAKEMGAALGVDVPPVERPDRWTRPAIAVIYVDGDITDGKSKSLPLFGASLAGGETLVEAVTAARTDPRIGAIILRVDSPGGSALASELISREVFATRGIKPIICSMSNVAASGGYFVSAGCDAIYAEPMTITGSIGIFSGKFDLGGLLAKIGVTTDTFKRGKHADVESRYRAYTDEERAALMDKLRYMYGRFVGSVAEGRAMDKDSVDKVGRGHVYTGDQAKPIKLIDKLGGIADAIDDAKHRMGLAPGASVQLIELPKLPSSIFGFIGDLLGVHAETPTMSVTDLPMVRELLRGIPVSLLVSPDAAQARLPFDVDWH